MDVTELNRVKMIFNRVAPGVEDVSGTSDNEDGSDLEEEELYVDEDIYGS
jgi:hypothetical protein